MIGDKLIDWQLLCIAFGRDKETEYDGITYDGTEDNLREELEDCGFEEKDIEKIVTDIRTLRRILVLGNHCTL